MNWVALEGADLDLVRRRLSIQPREIASAYVCRPAFYRDGLLLKLNAGRAVQLFIGGGSAVMEDMEFFQLHGGSGPIHAGNKAAGIDIRCAEDAECYLRFFCAVLRAEHGTFNILDALPEGSPSNAAGAFEVSPLDVFPDGEEGCYAATGCVEYAGGLFMADFKIYPDGQVEMTDDYPLVPTPPHLREGTLQ